MTSTPTCPDCNRRLEEGFLLDRSENGRAVARWIEGAPERSVWTGVKLKGRRNLPVSAWRCPRCGLLRFHALEP
jgi:hypothetical protein